MNKITTLSEYKLHKIKLNRDSYHKRKALLKIARNASGELIYKPRVKKEKSKIDTKPKRTKKKQSINSNEVDNPFYSF